MISKFREIFFPRYTANQRRQINSILLITNFQRMHITALSSLVVVVLFGLLPEILFQYLGLGKFQAPIRHLFNYYLAMSVLLCIYIGLYHLLKPRTPSGFRAYHAVLVISFMFLFIYMSIFLSLADQYITGALTLYTMGSIFLALLFYFPPAINAVLFVSGLIFFMLTLPAYQSDPLIIYRHYITAFELCIGALLASVFIYSFKCRQIAQIMRIQNQHKEIKRSNYLLKKNAEKLKKMDEEKNELMGIMAHDLKNPVSGIQGITELIELDPEMDKNQMKDLLGFLKNYSDRMNAIIVNLLNINAIDSGKVKMQRKEVNVCWLVRDTVAAYTLIASKKEISLEVLSGEENAMVYGDPDAIYQIMDNLISNAIKFSPLKKKIRIQIKSHKSSVSISVQDEGPGLTEEDKKKLFGRYAKLTARPTMNEHSTGLGLSIVHKLVSAMNGKVSCKSEPGMGATFIISLPSLSSKTEYRKNGKAVYPGVPA